MHFHQRQSNLHGRLASARLDGLLVGHLSNIRYLCGFTGSAGFLLVDPGGSVFFTDVRYDTQAHEEVKGTKVVIARKSLLETVGQALSRRKRKSRGWTLGIEADHCTVAEKKRLNAALPSGIRLKDSPAVVERQRMVKDQDE